jgi:leader peptidase (prepilin peptidase)/N-methyltransferase
MVETIALAIFGLFLGRLLNLTIDRLPPPSPSVFSAHPGHQYGFISLALLPVVSHFGLLGHGPGSIRLFSRSLTVEAISMLLCPVIACQYGLTLGAAILIFYCALFIHLTFVDLEHSLILNKVVLPALPVALALFPFSPLGQGWGIGEAYLRSLGGAGVGFAIMLAIYIASRGGTGAGDVKLAALLGAILGFPQILAGLPVGFVLGGALGILVLLLRIKGRKETIPFGPALVIGSALVLLLGPDTYGWYLDLFR